MITWRLFPFVRICFAFIFGILIQRWIPSFDIFIVVLLFLFLSIGYYLDFFRRKFHDIPIYLSFCLIFIFIFLGYVRSSLNQPTFSNKHYSKFIKDGDTGIGIIQEVPIKRTSQRAELQLLKICDSKQKKCFEVTGTAVCYFKLEDLKAKGYKPGDKIFFRGTLKEVNKNTNPHSFDFKLYLYNRRITHQVYIWGEEKHILIDQNCLSFIYQKAMNVREILLGIIEKYLVNTDEVAIASAMILGYKNMVSEDMYKAFSDSGAVHILAVSGMHLGILSAGLLFFLDKWKSNRNSVKAFKYIFVIIILWFFAFITGAAPAMLRAAVMFTFLLYAKYFVPVSNHYNILSLSALLMLLYDPYMIYQASFQFSYMAILSLTFFQPYIKNWWTPKTYISNFIWDLVSVALAAQVLVVPITIYFFHKFPVYFILTGVISVFLSNIALYLGLIIFLVEYLFSPINIILGYLFSIIMKLFIYSVQLVKEIPYCSIDGLILNDFEMIIIYVFLIMLMLYLVNKKFYLIKSMALIIVLFIISTGLRIHNANHQVGFTIYDDRKSNIIDIFDGRTVYGIRLDSLKENSNPFINLNNRYKNSINEFKEVGFDDFIGINSRKLNNVIQLKEKNLLIINNELDLFDLSDIDFLFLTNNLRFDSSIKLKPSIKIIVDRSFDQENLKSWEDNLSANKIYFHSIKNDGSFTVRI